MSKTPGQSFGRQVPGIYPFLQDMKKFGPVANKKLREGSVRIAKLVVDKAKQNASTKAERQVAKGLYAKFDRVPSIRVSNSRGFVSSSRPNSRRSVAAKARIIDVWFGTEFGGGKYGSRNTPAKSYADGTTVGGGNTTQFRPHKGRQGYFFYPTVRREGRNINRLYEQAIKDALVESGMQRAAVGSLKMVFGGR
jgi:hypothetical protein